LGPRAPIKLLALFALSLLLMAPASADDLIAQWLQQDDVSGQTEEVRPDLNAITDEQWREMLAIGREQPDAFAHLLVEHGSKSQTDIFLVWLAILTAALALLVGGIKGSAGIRRQLRTLTAPVPMNDPSQGLIATAK
jgi:hypothetical protein